MKIGYKIFKSLIGVGLFFYFKEIKVVGKENIPKGKPIMLLANHQNALMDPLLIGINCNSRPYFLARSDLFKNPIVRRILGYLQMIPIYRMRDGVGTLKNNKAIFKKCGQLLRKNETVMLFPEGNHGVQRRVRWPMRKGFVRILFSALELQPELDIKILPVGLNYVKADYFPDKVAIYIGKELSVQDYYDPKDPVATETKLKEAVFDRLTQLTTHIPDEGTYDAVHAELNRLNVNYLDPIAVNKRIPTLDPHAKKEMGKTKKSVFSQMFRILFVSCNFPMWILWHKVFKPLITDLEFVATIRFLACLVLFPVFYVVFYFLFKYMMGHELALLIILAHCAFNLAYVKRP